MTNVKIKFKGRRPSVMANDIKSKAMKPLLSSIRTMALEHFDNSFDKQGWEGVPWQSRKAPKSAGSFSKWNNWNAGRAILIGRGGQGGLRGSIKGNVNEQRGVVKITSNKIYSAVHNEGLRAGRGAGFRMPKRRFIGDSRILLNKIKNLIHKNINPILTK